MSKSRCVASIVVIAIGIVLIAVGLSITVPGDHLTTYESLAEKEGYSYIEEYVGGDAYNYIMGASLVAGHIAGTLAMKAVFIAGGAITSCIGLICLTPARRAERHDIQSARGDVSLVDVKEE